MLGVQTDLSPPVQCTLSYGVRFWAVNDAPGASTQTSGVTAIGSGMPEGIFLC